MTGRAAVAAAVVMAGMAAAVAWATRRRYPLAGSGEWDRQLAARRPAGGRHLRRVV